MKVILLLAGKGTRFLPLTETTPKPLIPVAGAPVLEHILAALKQIEIDELILITGYLSEGIETYLHENYDGPFSIVKQETLDGTGGAVYAAREHVDCPVLVVFGDTIFDVDLTGLNDTGTDGVIWTRAVEDYQRFGIVLTDELGNMLDIVEKPQEDVGRNANIGLYYIADHKALFEGLDRVVAEPPINGEWYFTYALNDMIKNGRTIKVRDVEGWYDCGNLTALIDTNEHFLTHSRKTSPPAIPGVTIIPPALIQDGVHLEDCQIGPNATIESGCRIQSSTIANSIIGRDCVLEGVTADKSLVGQGEHLTGTNIKGSIVAKGQIRNAA